MHRSVVIVRHFSGNAGSKRSPSDLRVEPSHGLQGKREKDLQDVLTRDNLPEHDNFVSIHEGSTRQSLTLLEGIPHQRLLKLKAALSLPVKVWCRSPLITIAQH